MLFIIALYFHYAALIGTNPMKISIILKGEVLPDQHEVLRHLVRKLQQEFVLQEEGCEEYEFYIDGDSFIMLERWANQAAFDNHTQTRHFSEFVPKMKSLVKDNLFSVEIIKSADRSYIKL